MNAPMHVMDMAKNGPTTAKNGFSTVSVLNSILGLVFLKVYLSNVCPCCLILSASSQYLRSVDAWIFQNSVNPSVPC